MKGNFVRKNLHKFCIPKIQQSKRRQALMAASVQDEDESDIPLDSEEQGCYDSGMNDVGTSSISINEGEE